ncbi:WD40 repeat domain-containing protein [Streptosporangium sp. NPDC004379]|uniref:WD40 repeat domain-containing protein n=1 Tax=Streptosporangium sp. NPDC004379 TaxID=3366189 RepID=UPI00369C38F1
MPRLSPSDSPRPFTGSRIDLEKVHTHQELTAALQALRIRADHPSTRKIEERTAGEETELKRNSISQILKGNKFPSKKVLTALVCALGENEIAPWHSAWERVALREYDDPSPEMASSKSMPPGPTGALLAAISDAKEFYTVAFHPKSDLLATGSRDGTIRLWNPITGGRIGEPLTGHTDAVLAMAFHPDGHLLATGGDDGTVRLWDPATRSPIGKPLTDHRGSVWAIAFHPDGHLLATGGEDPDVRLWHLTADSPSSKPLIGNDGFAAAIAFHPDGHLLATSGTDFTVQLWDSKTGGCIGTLTGHTDAILAMAFHPDGHLLATGGHDGTVRLWDPVAGTPIGKPLTGHTYSIDAVAFHPDGHLLATGGYDGTIRLWDLTTGIPVSQPLTNYEGAVTAVSFHPDGHLLASNEKHRGVSLWNIETIQSSPEALHRRIHQFRMRVTTLRQERKILRNERDDLAARLSILTAALKEGTKISPEKS